VAAATFRGVSRWLLRALQTKEARARAQTQASLTKNASRFFLLFDWGVPMLEFSEVHELKVYFLDGLSLGRF
jgi:hypothetical protein